MEAPVLVTGANGYVATHLIQQLLKKGRHVRGTVRDLKNKKKTEPLRSLHPPAADNLTLVEADLSEKDCWVRAVGGGVTEVYHVASPVPIEEPEDENEIIGPAVAGTLNVLEACRAAGTVRRVVITSSLAAVWNKEIGLQRRLDEDDWSDVTKIGAYMKSKNLAEKAAWNFMSRLADHERFDLVTVHPGVVMGPLLIHCYTASGEIPRRLLKRQVPAIPKVKIQIVDVRDVAAAHIRAMERKEANGKRHLLVGNIEGIWFSEAAKIINKKFKPMGYPIVTMEAPSVFVRVAAKFDPALRIMLPVLDKKIEIDNSRMVNVLGVKPTPIEKTIIDMCHSLIELGIVKKKPNYRPQKKSNKKKRHSKSTKKQDPMESISPQQDIKESTAPQQDPLESIAPKQDPMESISPQQGIKESTAPQQDPLESIAPQPEATNEITQL